MILAVGSQEAVGQGIALLSPRGRLVMFSAVAGLTPVDLFRVHVKELQIVGACNDQDLIDPALACLADPELRLDSLVTHHLPFADWRRGFELAAEASGHGR